MNSMSKGYHDSCKKEKREEENHCPTIIKCGFPRSTTIPTTMATSTNRTFTVTSLTLDTSCLCDPTIKLEFASNIVIGGSGDFTGTINFQVLKQCRHQFTPVPVGPSWTFAEAGVENGTASTFSFFVCDGDSCFDECCTYTVVATVISSMTTAPINVNNATLGAIATCESNKCRKECEEKHDRKRY